MREKQETQGTAKLREERETSSRRCGRDTTGDQARKRSEKTAGVQQQWKIQRSVIRLLPTRWLTHFPVCCVMVQQSHTHPPLTTSSESKHKHSISWKQLLLGHSLCCWSLTLCFFQAERWTHCRHCPTVLSPGLGGRVGSGCGCTINPCIHILSPTYVQVK